MSEKAFKLKPLSIAIAITNLAALSVNAQDLTTEQSPVNTEVRATINVPISDDLAMRTSFSRVKQDGYTENVYNGPSVTDPSKTFIGEDMDNIDNLSVRTDLMRNASDTLNIRFLAQFFTGESNGAGIKGIDDPTPGARNLSQDTDSSYELDSKVFGLIAEWDAGFAVINLAATTALFLTPTRSANLCRSTVKRPIQFQM